MRPTFVRASYYPLRALAPALLKLRQCEYEREFFPARRAVELILGHGNPPSLGSLVSLDANSAAARNQLLPQQCNCAIEKRPARRCPRNVRASAHHRSEEHTSELQSRPHLVCRLLLEKKKKTK